MLFPRTHWSIIMSPIDSTLWQVTPYSRRSILFCKKIRSLELTKEQCVCVKQGWHCEDTAVLGSIWDRNHCHPSDLTEAGNLLSSGHQDGWGLGQVFTPLHPALYHIHLMSHWPRVWIFTLHQPTCLSLSVLESWKRKITGPALI